MDRVARNLLEMIRLTKDRIHNFQRKSMKQTDLEVSDLKRKIKLRFNEIQQSGKLNKSVRNLKSEHVREKTLAKGFRWHDQNTDQICFPKQN